MKHLSLILIALFAMNSWAADLTQEMDSLGANQELMKKANAIDPDNQVQIVQKREVDRTNRLELGINYGFNATGGDPYINTSSLGGEMDYHFNPHWSIGARYYNYTNTYNAEGRAVISDANANLPGSHIPSVTWAHDSYMGVIDWYPVYGKLNFFDASVIQFDLYLLGGGGVIDLSTGSSPIYTAGGGIGIWFTQHIASRLEVRWQGYQDQAFDGTEYNTRNENETVLSFALTFLL